MNKEMSSESTVVENGSTKGGEMAQFMANEYPLIEATIVQYWTASDPESTSATDSNSSLATVIEKKFHLIKSIQTLSKLIKNAYKAQPSTNEASTKSTNLEMYRKIRLHNTAIQDRVVKMPHALPILQLTGFEELVLDNEVVLLCTEAENPESIQKANYVMKRLSVLQEQLQDSVSKLQQERESLQRRQATGISEEERKRRQRQAIQARKLKEQQLRENQLRWKEDCEERAVAAERKEIIKKQQQAAEEPSSNETATSNPAVSSIKKLASTPPVGDGTSLSQLRLELAQRRLSALDPTKQAEHHEGEEEALQVESMQTDNAVAAVVVNETDKSITNAEERVTSSSSLSGSKRQRHGIHQEEDQTQDAKPAALDENHGDDQVKQEEVTMSETITTIVPTITASQADSLWQEHVKSFSRCRPVAGLRESIEAWGKPSKGMLGLQMQSSSTTLSSVCLKRLLSEFTMMEESLPKERASSVWICFDEDAPQYIRTMITGPANTPYSTGVFIFDMIVPSDYPKRAPHVHLLTTGGGTVRFGPNLYADGKVCLSLLGTWPGPKWDPARSNIHQILVSIQGMVLGTEHPYYLEPGHGGWEGKVKEGDFATIGYTLSGKKVKEEFKLPRNVEHYDNRLRWGTLQYAMLQALEESTKSESDQKDDNMGDVFKRKGKHFGVEDIVRFHFYCNQTSVVEVMRDWLDRVERSGQATAQQTMTHHDDDERIVYNGMSSSTLHDRMRRCAAKVKEHLAKLTLPLPPKGNDGEAFANLSKLASSTSISDVVQDMQVEEDDDDDCKKPAAVPTFGPPAVAKMTPQQPSAKLNSGVGVAKKPPLQLPTSKGTALSRFEVMRLKQEMQQAASSKDFIKAGQIQQQLAQYKRSLQEQMKIAVGKQDYISAGQFQQQLQALEEDLKPDPKPKEENLPGMKWGDGYKEGFDWEQNRETLGSADEVSDDDDDDDDDDQEQQVPIPSITAGINTALSAATVPLAAQKPVRLRHHLWGQGNVLGSTSASASAPTITAAGADPTVVASKPTSSAAHGPRPRSGALAVAKASATGTQQAPSPSRSDSTKTTRLRIRLPGNLKSVVEDFSPNDPLTAVYRRLEPQIVPDPSATPPPESTWSSTLDDTVSFTLLLARPKKEFSLEMHGSQTLADLGLSPSATLTVLLSRERGMVRRGQLEDRLGQASGDAMDVDGLGYESLLELTERVGVATPLNQRRVFGEKGLLAFLDYHSTPIKSIEAAASEDDPIRCPICLEEFQSEQENEKDDDTGKQASDQAAWMRQMKCCGKVFHRKCLTTWLSTKSACPYCNRQLDDPDGNKDKDIDGENT